MEGCRLIPVKVGEKIPLSLQVYDGNPDLSVKCNLLDTSGKLFFTVPLSHISNGLYLNSEVEMPENDYLIAQYQTNKPMDYEIAQDVFKSIPKVQLPEKYILGEVIDTVALSKVDDLLIGEVQDVNEEM